jgi:sarcosine oxidase gamma subunit
MAEVSTRAPEGIGIELTTDAPAAALRHFSGAREFTAALAGLGITLPEAGRARQTRAHLLAWRSPTETLCLAASAAALEELAAPLASTADGCLVELTGALHVISLSGPRCNELLLRLGSSASVPLPGEARRSRMADVPVLALSVNAGEVHLVLERTYGEHVCGWLEASLEDLP